MDTAAYLQSQGWAGHGHALHHSGRGIIKPLTVNLKNNVLGIGKKKHDAHADQWWARAFDETLKGITTTRDVTTGAIEGLELGTGAQALEMAGTGAASLAGKKNLYGHFVRGESLGGTLTPEEVSVVEGTSTTTSKSMDGDTLVEPEVAVVEAVPKEKRKKDKRHERRNGEADTPGEANTGDGAPGRGLDVPREEPERAIPQEQRKSKKRKERNIGAEVEKEAIENTALRPPKQMRRSIPFFDTVQVPRRIAAKVPGKVKQVESPQRKKFWESILGPSPTPEDTQSAPRSNEPIEKPKRRCGPEEKKVPEKRRRRKDRTQREILEAKIAKANRVREKKIVDPELRKARIARKNDRHKAIRTKQMIEDDRESYRKLWKGEIPTLDREKKKNWQFCTDFEAFVH